MANKTQVINFSRENTKRNIEQMRYARFKRALNYQIRKIKRELNIAFLNLRNDNEAFVSQSSTCNQFQSLCMVLTGSKFNYLLHRKRFMAPDILL